MRIALKFVPPLTEVENVSVGVAVERAQCDSVLKPVGREVPRGIEIELADIRGFGNRQWRYDTDFSERGREERPYVVIGRIVRAFRNDTHPIAQDIRDRVGRLRWIGWRSVIS